MNEYALNIKTRIFVNPKNLIILFLLVRAHELWFEMLESLDMGSFERTKRRGLSNVSWTHNYFSMYKLLDISTLRLALYGNRHALYGSRSIYFALQVLRIIYF